MRVIIVGQELKAQDLVELVLGQPVDAQRVAVVGRLQVSRSVASQYLVGSEVDVALTSASKETPKSQVSSES